MRDRTIACVSLVTFLFSSTALIPSAVFAFSVTSGGYTTGIPDINPSSEAVMDTALKEEGLGAFASDGPTSVGGLGGVSQGGEAAGEAVTEGIVTSSEADAMCTVVYPTCPCNSVPSSKGCVAGVNQYRCPGSCFAPTPVGPVMGTCVANEKCLTVSAPGIGGIGNALSGFGTIALGAGLAITAVSLLLNSKSAGGDAGNTGGANSAGSLSGSGTICSTFTPVNDPTLTAANPCTYYVPSNGAATGGAPVAPSSVIATLLNEASTSSDLNTDSSAVNQSHPVVTTADAPAPSGPDTEVTAPRPIAGGIQIFATGATIFALAESDANTAADFYGISIDAGETPQKSAARLCAAHPWTLRSLPYIASTFFDTLCRSNGFATQ